MYHVNPVTGDAGKCTAKSGNCPFGGLEEHYTTPEAARKAYEATQEAFKSAPVNASDEDVQKAISNTPGLRGKTIDAAKRYLISDYEAAQKVPQLLDEDLIKAYGTVQNGLDMSNFDVEYKLDDPKNPQAIISYKRYSWLDESGDPLVNVQNLVDSDYDFDDGDSTYSYTVNLRPQEAEMAKAHLVRQLLGERYLLAKDSDYPDWMILNPGRRYGYSYPDYGVTRDYKKALKELETASNKLNAAKKAGLTNPKHEQRISQLDKDLAENDEALNQLTSPRLKKLIADDRKNLEAQRDKLTNLRDSNAKKSSTVNIKQLEQRVADARAVADSHAANFREAVKDHTVTVLNARHPAKDGRRSAAQAKAWVESHPGLVQKEIAKNSVRWGLS